MELCIGAIRRKNMLILTIILGIISLSMAIFLVFLKKEVKSINEQLEYINSHDTNKIIQTSYNNKEFIALSSNIDALLKECKKTTIKEKEINHRLKEDITNLSHDIRTPLTSLKGYFELMNSTDVPEKKQYYEEIIKDRIECLGNLLEQLFTYAKIQNNAYSFELEKVNVSEQLKKSIFLFYDVMKKYGINPNMNIPENDMYAICNNEVVSRIFQNIIKNAVAHGDYSFDVSMYKSNEYVYFRFSNGCKNVKELSVERVFDKFYRADKARTGTSSGLGLYIVKELAEKMNGGVEASIEESKFVIKLKLKSI